MIEIGMLARSKAGHDKDQVFIIIGIEGEYVFLADGNNRPICRPKKKKIKHIQIIKERYEIEAADDAAIRKILKSFETAKMM